MKAANVLVFDEVLQSSSSPYYTDQSLNDKLGYFDQLAIMAVVDNVTSGSTGFQVNIEHSGDGRIWLPKKSTSAEVSASGALVASTQTAYWGSDDGSTPSLGHVRLKVTLGASTSAHVRIFVTGRNAGH